MLETEIIVEITEADAPYAPKEQLGSYKLRRWTWYEKQVCLNRASEVLDAKKGLVRTPMPDYNSHMLLITLRESPLNLTGKPEVDIEKIRTLDAELGDILFEAATNLNTVTPEEKEDF